MSRVRFQGTVTRVFSKGFDVTEVTRSGDREFKQQFTVWSEDRPAEGSTVTVEGLLSLSVDEWKGREGDVRHSVKASVNKPTITVEQAQAQDWAATEGTPF